MRPQAPKDHDPMEARAPANETTRPGRGLTYRSDGAIDITF